MKKTIIAAVVVVILGFGVFQAKSYYDNRYVKDSEYYVYVPENQSIEIEDIIDDSGKVVDKGKSYSFIGMNKDGEKRTLEFSYTTEDVNKLLQPHTYVKVSASKTIVLGQQVISESEVPSSILNIIKTLN